MRGRLLVGLAAGQKRDAGYGRRDAGPQDAQSLFRNFIDRCALCRLFTGHHHVGFEHHAFEGDTLEIKLLELELEHHFGHLVAAVDVVAAVHQYFRFDDRYDAFVLAKCGIPRERMGIRANAGVARDRPVGDIDYRAPLGELRTEPAVLNEALTQAIEPLGDYFARTKWKRLSSFVDLDARNGAGLLDEFDERRAVLGGLSDCFIVQNDAGNIFRHRIAGAEQHFAIVAAIVRRRLDAKRVEALFDRAG